VIIDAYSHCGITKFLPVEKVRATMNEAGVERAVLCQHLDEYDNSYISGIVTQYPEQFAGICLVDPDQPDALNQLRQCHLTGSFRGIRLLAEWLIHKQPFYLEAIDLGMNLVIYAPGGIRDAVPHVLKVIQARPRAKIVISHLGNPKVVEQHLTQGSELFELVGNPSVYVQLSGYSMFCDYPYTPLDGFISEVIRRFDPSRLMWGSNFPVCGDIHSYRRDLALVQSGAWGLDQEGIQWVTGRSARRLWFD
jgi:L-fuconolactonase